jgi:hypothetical protein
VKRIEWGIGPVAATATAAETQRCRGHCGRGFVHRFDFGFLLLRVLFHFRMMALAIFFGKVFERLPLTTIPL